MPPPRLNTGEQFITTVLNLLPFDETFADRGRCIEDETKGYFAGRPMGDRAVLAMAVCGTCTERPSCLAADMLTNSHKDMTGVVGGLTPGARIKATKLLAKGEIVQAHDVISTHWERIDAALGDSAVHERPYFPHLEAVLEAGLPDLSA